MRTGYEVLGNYIRLVDKRNRDLSITNLLGVSIEKRFIPSIANIIGTDLSNYKVVQTGQFAYGPVTSRNGEKISIAYLEGEDCIISSSYTVFEVINKNKLDPEYSADRSLIDMPVSSLMEASEKSWVGTRCVMLNFLFLLSRSREVSSKLTRQSPTELL